MNKISNEIAHLIRERWNVQEEDLVAQPLVSLFDSLDRVVLAMELEQKYGITIMDEELHDWAWYSDIIDCVCRKVSEKDSGKVECKEYYGG